MMWRAVGALIVFGLVSSFCLSGVGSAFAQDGYAGEGGPQVPMPAIGNAGQAQEGSPATRKKVHGGAETPGRKPRKPVPRSQTASEKKKAKKKPPAPTTGSERDKHLCKALQACRNKFVRCKSKIKHPDQSEAWSRAKEECGEVYKACVAKDFQSGEWFFTRWFYFKELDCK